jgi:hypothetical protein
MNVPSSYSGGASRSNGDKALPQEGCRRLLHVPSKDRYLIGTQAGSMGHVSPSKLNRVSIAWSPSPACSGESLKLRRKSKN